MRTMQADNLISKSQLRLSGAAGCLWPASDWLACRHAHHSTRASQACCVGETGSAGRLHLEGGPANHKGHRSRVVQVEVRHQQDINFIQVDVVQVGQGGLIGKARVYAAVQHDGLAPDAAAKWFE